MVLQPRKRKVLETCFSSSILFIYLFFFTKATDISSPLLPFHLPIRDTRENKFIDRTLIISTFIVASIEPWDTRQSFYLLRPISLQIHSNESSDFLSWLNFSIGILIKPLSYQQKNIRYLWFPFFFSLFSLRTKFFHNVENFSLNR